MVSTIFGGIWSDLGAYCVLILVIIVGLADCSAAATWCVCEERSQRRREIGDGGSSPVTRRQGAVPGASCLVYRILRPSLRCSCHGLSDQPLSGGLLFIYGLSALGLDWIVGWAGQASLANGPLMAIGAIETAYISTRTWKPRLFRSRRARNRPCGRHRYRYAGGEDFGVSIWS